MAKRVFFFFNGKAIAFHPRQDFGGESDTDINPHGTLLAVDEKAGKTGSF
jgi:hypothetical protein